MISNTQTRAHTHTHTHHTFLFYIHSRLLNWFPPASYWFDSWISASGSTLAILFRRLLKFSRQMAEVCLFAALCLYAVLWLCVQTCPRLCASISWSSVIILRHPKVIIVFFPYRRFYSSSSFLHPGCCRRCVHQHQVHGSDVRELRAQLKVHFLFLKGAFFSCSQPARSLEESILGLDPSMVLGLFPPKQQCMTITNVKWLRIRNVASSSSW